MASLLKEETERWGALCEEKEQEGGLLLERHGKCFTGVLTFNGQNKKSNKKKFWKIIVIFYNLKKIYIAYINFFIKNFKICWCSKWFFFFFYIYKCSEWLLVNKKIILLIGPNKN